jgi:hypothetical protein
MGSSMYHVKTLALGAILKTDDHPLIHAGLVAGLNPS